MGKIALSSSTQPSYGTLATPPPENSQPPQLPTRTESEREIQSSQAFVVRQPSSSSSSSPIKSSIESSSARRHDGRLSARQSADADADGDVDAVDGPHQQEIDVSSSSTPALLVKGMKVGPPVPYSRLTVGVLKETYPGENRVSLAPVNVRTLVDAGLKVVVESGGECCFF
jgi:hypothetical protein